MVRKRGVGRSTVRVRGDLAADSREAGLAFVFALGVGRRRAVPLVEESLGVERRELDCEQGVREEELVARSVEVDAERELLDLLWYEEGREGLGAVCVGQIARGEGGHQGAAIPGWKGYAS